MYIYIYIFFILYIYIHIMPSKLRGSMGIHGISWDTYFQTERHATPLLILPAGLIV